MRLVGITRGQSGHEVRRRRSVALMQPARDHRLQHRPRPPLSHSSRAGARDLDTTVFGNLPGRAHRRPRSSVAVSTAWLGINNRYLNRLTDRRTAGMIVRGGFNLLPVTARIV